MDAGDDAIANAAAEATAYANPGPFEGLTNAAKSLVFVDTFDGARIDISKQLSPMMMCSHNFWLGTAMVPNATKQYTFATQVYPDETTFAMARVTQEGQVEGRIHKVLSAGPDGFAGEDTMVNGKVVIVASPGKGGGNDQMVAEVDVNSKTWTGGAKWGTMGGGNYAALNYLQCITPNLAMGGDATYIGAQNTSVGSYGARYTGPTWVGAMQWSGTQGAMSLNYKKTVTRERVALGAELQFSPATMDSAVSLGAEVNLKQSKFQTVVDGTGVIKTTLETSLGPQAKLIFSSEVDHLKDSYKFGYGMNIGG